MSKQQKHDNYEVLNLIGYGLAKFNMAFVKSFGLTTKTAFYEYIVKQGIAETTGTVKNRQDLFDQFFDNGRRGWWQKGDAYIHRKVFIDSLFGTLDVQDYANIVKLYLLEQFDAVDATNKEISPVLKSKFKQLQLTGLEAELFFMHNYRMINSFEYGILEDARLFGDGYDFQIKIQNHFFLAEIKGIRSDYGNIRMTLNEFKMAKEYDKDYALVVVSNLNEIPKMSTIFNPVETISFSEKATSSTQISYHSRPLRWH